MRGWGERAGWEVVMTINDPLSIIHYSIENIHTVIHERDEYTTIVKFDE
jgi:hypothetical protein